MVIVLALQSQTFAFDSLAVFGDSLSDTGNNGRWTWNSNQNKLYNEQLASDNELFLTPSNKGGQNYATAGATASNALNPLNNTANQIKQWLAKNGGKADGYGLFIHWVGGNDLAAAILLPDQARTIVTNSAAAAGAQVGQLLNAGAGLVVVPTVPDISASPLLLEKIITSGLGPQAPSAIKAAFASLNATKTPTLAHRRQAIREAFSAAASAISDNPQIQQTIFTKLTNAYEIAAAQASTLTNYYNAVEEVVLMQLRGNIVRADINGLFREALANPGLFGVTNTSGMACPPGILASECSSSTPGFSRTLDYLFADHFHPGPQIHNIMAQYIHSIVAAPVQISSLNQSVQAMVYRSRASLDSRFQQLRQGNNPVGAVGVFSGYSGKYQRLNSTNNVAIGVDYQLSENLLLGGLIGGARYNQHSGSNYRYDIRGYQTVLFGHFRAGPAWIDSDVSYLSVDFTNIQRKIILGALNRIEQGRTGGKQWGARLTVGYDFPVMSWLYTGPVLQYVWDYSNVNGYSEKGNTSTSMRFGDQSSHSQVGSVGWRLGAHTRVVNPWAQVNYYHQFGDNVYVANGGLKSTSLTFTRTGGEVQDKNWANFAVGLDLSLSEKVSAFAAVAQTVSMSFGSQTSYNTGISIRF